MPWVEDYHASVFIRGPLNQTVLITDLRRPPPQLWKFPGGSVDHSVDADPFDTAIREVKEETGLTIKRENMCFLESMNLGTHTKYFFEATADSFDGFQKRSEEDEIAGIFDFDYLHKMVDIHPNYYDVFCRAIAE